MTRAVQGMKMFSTVITVVHLFSWSLTTPGTVAHIYSPRTFENSESPCVCSGPVKNSMRFSICGAVEN